MYNYKIVVTDSDIKYLIQKDESLKAIPHRKECQIPPSVI